MKEVCLQNGHPDIYVESEPNEKKKLKYCCLEEKAVLPKYALFGPAHSNT